MRINENAMKFNIYDILQKQLDMLLQPEIILQ